VTVFRRTFLPLFGLLLLSATARAGGDVPDFLTARGVAIGGTRALASGNEAIFLNPAGLAVTRTYTIQLDYGHDTAPSSALTSGDGLVVSVGDSSTNPRLATGIAYRYVSLNAGGMSRRGSITDVALATPLSDHIFLGLRMSYLSFTDGPTETKSFTGDVGAIFALGYLRLSGVGFNLLTVDNPSAARGFSTGFALTNNASLSVGGDVRWTYPGGGVTYRTYSVGGEYVLFDAVPLRAGFVADGTTSQRFLTFGTGFYISSFGFDATYRRDLSTSEGTWLFSVKMLGGS
jgi:hypothetical protein